MDKYKNLAPLQIYCMLFLFRISSLISLTNETGYGRDIRYSLIAPFVYFLISCALSYMLSGYHSLYHEQRFVLSKLKADSIDEKAI